ncbi:hypothetical protein FCK90_00720 [Kocuria coralli]|uniref:3-hydroxyacyl-CoA dehydrogenase n=1 Tax=Kocuria coralli TaxID=1461025 RepID=A0A5J5L0W3_9MICC|nr:Rv3235 family protein [Kocuria coralli]KAA9395584.1 hypothetical protein FCK90_00720 [Kocuria coralli]
MSIVARNESTPRRAAGYIWRAEQRAAQDLRPGTERERVTALTRAVTVAALEVLAGTRTAGQLLRWTTPEIVEKLRRRAELLQQRRTHEPSNTALQGVYRHSEVVRQRVCHVADGVYEVALVVRDDARTRAVVLRAERPEQAWRITILEIG